MDERQLSLQLQQDGFIRTYAWQDGPNAFYPDHTHDTETAHIILSGEMTMRMNGHDATYREGERCDVPAGAVHSAKMGPKGCRYLIGERSHQRLDGMRTRRRRAKGVKEAPVRFL